MNIEIEINSKLNIDIIKDFFENYYPEGYAYRNKEIINMYYNLDGLNPYKISMEKIGVLCGISTDRVRQIICRFISKYRMFLKKRGIDISDLLF